MKIQELRRMNFDDLQAKLAESSEEIFKLKFRLVTQPLDDPLRIRRIRRDIARIKTLIREREIGGIAPNAPTAPRTASESASVAKKKTAKKAASTKTKAKAKTAKAPKTSKSAKSAPKTARRGK
jgi:large subunit ribosomal protein L29